MAEVATATTPKKMLAVWQQHFYLEFAKRDATAALGTMSDNPHVLMVPFAIGGRGRDGVYNFYHNYFLAQLPADMTAVPISQVIGEKLLAEEAVYHFTHDQVMDWLIPAVPLKGKRVEVGVVGIISFENSKIASEHLYWVYWNHARMLAQVGVIDQPKNPVKGVEGPRTLLEWAGVTAVKK